MQARLALGLQGYWSDINHNGLPEFAVEYNYCLWACHGMQGVETRFFEIRDSTTVVDITKDLPGVVLPWGFLHSKSPLTIFVYTPVDYGHYYEQVELDLIYQWDSTKYINVTPRYADEYHKQVKETVADIHTRYGRALARFDLGLLLKIPVLYNVAELPRQDGLEIFLEVTELAHWPGTDKAIVCWLQVTRAYAQIDYEQDVPFRINPFWAGFVPDEQGTGLSEMTADIDVARFDVSACQ